MSIQEYINKGLSIIEDKDDIQKKIKENNKILLGNKKFLLKKLEEFSNNDNDPTKEDLTREEKEQILNKLEKYKEIDKKYYNFKQKLKEKYKKLFTQSKSTITQEVKENDGDGNINTYYYDYENNVMDENIFIKKLNNYFQKITPKDFQNIENFLKEKEQYYKEINNALGKITKSISYINGNFDKDIMQDLFIKLAIEYVNNKQKYEKLNQVQLLKKLLETTKIPQDKLKILGNLGIVVGNKIDQNGNFNKNNYIVLKDYEKPYSEILKEQGLDKDIKKFLSNIINKISGNKKFIVNGKKIKFTKELIIRKNKDIIENFKKMLIFFMNIESYGGKNIEHKLSSAKGLLQWIDGWKNGKKHKKYNRDSGNYSPFENGLRRAAKFYTEKKWPTFQEEEIPKYIKDAWKNKGKLDLKTFDINKQIKLMVLDLIIKSPKSKELFIKTLLGDKNSMKILYKVFWHTNTEKGSSTEKLVNKNIKNIILNNIG